MELEQTNTVGETAEKIQLHVFACHERIHELKAALESIADSAPKTEPKCEHGSTIDAANWAEWNLACIARDALANTP